jgi:DNA-binding transcriptional regulator YiaG
VQKWEQGKREPTGAARVLLRIIAKNQTLALQALEA